mgnify:CR=1 FL=1
MTSSVRVLLALGAMLSVLDAPPLWAAPKPPLCTAGRFAVEGAPLIRPGGEVVVLANKTVAIGAVCAPRPAKLRRASRGTGVKVTFTNGACSGVAGKVKLTATISSDCATMTGKLKAPKTDAVSFTAATLDVRRRCHRRGSRRGVRRQRDGLRCRAVLQRRSASA